MTTKERILEGLNPEQREAVLHTEGPLLILAGAGSGKTRVLTHRLAWLVREHGINPSSLLAITFTNKAAEEMRRRLQDLVGGASRAMWISTFHAACARMLRRDAERLGYQRNFVIYDEEDQRRLILKLMHDNEMDVKRYPPRAVRSRISLAKNELVTWEDYKRRARDDFEAVVGEVYRLYQESMARHNAMDFDDLLVNALALLELYPSLLEEYQEKFHYISVDEYQDTNRAQYRWVNLLAERRRNLCVVGDDDQSIYSWRGADLRNILDFERDYPEARVIRLERNYRSTRVILDAAHGVVQGIRGRKPKKLWTDREGGEPVRFFQADSDYQEALFVAEEIGALTARGYRLNDVAVFYRINAQSRPFEEVMLRLGIPYRIVGGFRFYERREVKDILAYLRLLANPADDVSLLRVVNVPRRGIGDTTLGHLQAHASLHGICLWEAMQKIEEVPGVGSGPRRRIAEFVGLVRQLEELVAELPLPELVRQVQEKSGYLEELRRERTLEAQGRLENLEELVRVAEEFEQNRPGEGLQGFLEQVSLLSDIDYYDEEEGALTLMTLHNAKGLEFPVVFMVGMLDGVFPHSRSVVEGREDEERRLCYVGITRARDLLYLTCSSHRSLYGQTDWCAPSPYIKEIPEDLLERVGAVEVEEKAVQREMERLREFAESIQVGDRVLHKVFGTGVVREVSVSSSGPEVTVDFPELGPKRLLLAYAPLTRLKE